MFFDATQTMSLDGVDSAATCSDNRSRSSTQDDECKNQEL